MSRFFDNIGPSWKWLISFWPRRSRAGAPTSPIGGEQASCPGPIGPGITWTIFQITCLWSNGSRRGSLGFHNLGWDRNFWGRDLAPVSKRWPSLTPRDGGAYDPLLGTRSEEHTSELQSL